MFYRTVTTKDSSGTTQTEKTFDLRAVGLACVILLVIFLGAFWAFNIKFTEAVGPLMTTFTTGAGAVFGALVGESRS